MGQPNNKLKRWASPCNIYEGWMWQDQNQIYFHMMNVLKLQKTSEYYKKQYTVLIKPQDIPNHNIFKFLPKNIKIIIKRFLSFILPKHFG